MLQARPPRVKKKCKERKKVPSLFQRFKKEKKERKEKSDFFCRCKHCVHKRNTGRVSFITAHNAYTGKNESQFFFTFFLNRVIGAVWEIANLPLVQHQQKLSVRDLWRNQQYAVVGGRMSYTDAWRLVATVCEVFQSESWCKTDFV